MHIFEITVQRKQDQAWPVVVQLSDPSVSQHLPVRKEGFLQLDPKNLRRRLTPRDYGTVLGKALFCDWVGQAFAQARIESNDRLRVLLFVEDDKLKNLRWERLCAPIDGQWDFLALDQRVPFSLYLPSMSDRRFPPIGRRDLRVLVLVASPQDSGDPRYGLSDFDVASVVANVRMALGDIPCEVLAMIEGVKGPPTLDKLCEQITHEQYTLLHLVCHGQLDRDGNDTTLYFAKSDNQVDPVNGTRLIDRLRRLRGPSGLPYFAFLAACESASAQAEEALGGLAQRMVRELGMPAVVAMTERISVGTAQALSHEFYRRLQKHGEVDRALVEARAGLADRYDINVPALYSRLAGRPLFSVTVDHSLTDEQITFGLSHLENLLEESAPVLKPRFSQIASMLRGILPAELVAPGAGVRLEREKALTEINVLCEEVVECDFNALALRKQPPAYDTRCPFRGLYPFHMEDREFFFGRGELVERLQQRLNKHNFLAVLGSSGSGKSSLVLSGLFAALQAKEMGLQMVYLTPGSKPFAQLEVSLTKVRSRHWILVVDQFEEVFTLCTNDAEREDFLRRVLSLAKETKVVLTMRADFWGQCALHRDLKALMQEQQELIGPMNMAELRRAMEMQASTVGLRFEADLTNMILDDVQGEPGAMPLLQHALLELWKRRHGRWLRPEEYRAIGGVQKAIAHTAEQVYETLSPPEQEEVRNVFLRLTRLDVEPRHGEEWRDTRRRVSMDELTPTGGNQTATKTLLARLANARLVVTSQNLLTRHEEVEVAHEALIRHWPRLSGWLDDDRASLRTREGIRDAAREWEDGGGDDSLLVHRGSRLQDAAALSKDPKFPLNQREQSYVDACEALRDREKAEEEERLEESERRRRINVAERLATHATSVLPQDAKLALPLAVEALEVTLGRGEPAVPPAEQSLRNAFLIGGKDLAENEAKITVALSVNDPQTGTTDIDETARLADWVSKDPAPALITFKRFPAERADRGDGYDPTDVSPLAFSPNGRWLAMTLPPSDRTANTTQVRLWELTGQGGTGKFLDLPRHRGLFLFDLAFSPDSRWLAAAGGDSGSAWLWNLAAQDPLELRHGTDPLAVAFSLDGSWLATAGWNSSVRLWDLNAPNIAETFISLTGPTSGPVCDIQSVAFSQDSRRLAAAHFRSEDGAEIGFARVWDLTVNNPIDAFDDLLLSGQKGTRALAVAFSADPHACLLATVGGGGFVRVWDLTARPRVTHDLPGHEQGVSAVAFSPDSRWLATAGADKTARLWDLRASDPAVSSVVLAGHKRPISHIAFSPDGRWLATGSADGTIRLWLLTLKELMKLAAAVGRNLSHREWQRYFHGQEYRPTFARLPVPDDPPEQLPLRISGP